MVSKAAASATSNCVVCRPWLVVSLWIEMLLHHDAPTRFFDCLSIFISATSNNVHRVWNRLEDEQWTNSGLSISTFPHFKLDNWLPGILVRRTCREGQLSYCNCGRCFGEAELSRIFRRLFSILRVNACAYASVKRFSLLQRTTLEMLIGCYRRTYKTVFGKRSLCLIPNRSVMLTSCAGKTCHARRKFFVSKLQYFLSFKYIQI